jgi:phosphoribosyl-ATP pyrophosphohydrolase
LSRDSVAPQSPDRDDHARTDGVAGADILARLADVIESRRAGDPARSYVARLLAGGEDSVLKKIGEEATETVLAAKDGAPDRIVAETADLWFHCLVMLARYGLRPEQVLDELQRREGLSGLDEKAARKAAAAEVSPPAAARTPTEKP